MLRKRKKYKFGLFADSPLCFEVGEWANDPRPQILEMGAGTGLFSVAMAESLPEKQVLAVDVKADRLQSGARLASNQELHNIQFLRARADQLSDLLISGSLETIWITFPDPFPKDRSAKHRLTHPKFLKIYAELLRPNGALYLKTDAHPLFDWSVEQLVQSGWKIEELSFDLHESSLPASYKVMTTYEKRFTSEGLPTHFVKATLPAASSPNHQ